MKVHVKKRRVGCTVVEVHPQSTEMCNVCGMLRCPQRYLQIVSLLMADSSPIPPHYPQTNYKKYFICLNSARIKRKYGIRLICSILREEKVAWSQHTTWGNSYTTVTTTEILNPSIYQCKELLQ